LNQRHYSNSLGKDNSDWKFPGKPKNGNKAKREKDTLFLLFLVDCLLSALSKYVTTPRHVQNTLEF